MKKLLLLILLTGFTTALFAQEAPQTQLRFRGGIVFGLNASQVDGDNYAGYHKLGITGGFIAQVPVSKKFFFSMEILYSQKGAKSISYPDVPLAYLLRLHYAEVPILINFQEKSAINFGAGVAYGRLVKIEEYIDPLVYPVPDDDFNKSDFTALVNANYLITPHFQLNARFAYSIVPMGHNLYSNFKNHAMYNNLLSFRLAYVF